MSILLLVFFSSLFLALFTMSIRHSQLVFRKRTRSHFELWLTYQKEIVWLTNIPYSTFRKWDCGFYVIHFRFIDAMLFLEIDSIKKKENNNEENAQLNVKSAAILRLNWIDFGCFSSSFSNIYSPAQLMELVLNLLRFV